EAVLELNNELKTAVIEEGVEVERILSDLSHSVGLISEHLSLNIDLLSDIDVAFAKAEYAYKTRSVMPQFNDKGQVVIKKGRHPLIAPEKVVAIDIEFGLGYNYLLVTGPNTGGKTVTLKLVGLFSLMAMTGMFVPAADGSVLSFFSKIFSDIGDEQSIEQSLSTFSSHLKNIINITENADNKSLVLVDEIGAGTDPDEGSALAQAVIEKLLDVGSKGIITTHYSRLKEFAYSRSEILNASMDFNSETFEPLYRIVIGMPGSSNAIEISKRLGIDTRLTDRAYSLLTDSKISFEKVLREAEKTRQEAEVIKSDYYKLKSEVLVETDKLKAERVKLENDRQRFLQGAKAEARRIVNEKAEIAEDLIAEIKELLKKETLDSGDIISARTLKNKIENVKYDIEERYDEPVSRKPVDVTKLKIGDSVYVPSIDGVGIVQRLSKNGREAEVVAGSIRLNVKTNQLYMATNKANRENKSASVSIKRDIVTAQAVKTEINVIGQTADEALLNVEKFVDTCLLNNIEECRIVHGKGLNILSKAIQSYLKKNPRVVEFRFGAYGEGEKGVTIVKLK
ncbi:MAG: Smr/MutS family protein, partial [Clostridia bacterium]|nr:Smr/MutS family protein [Clostridia bacterium]